MRLLSKLQLPIAILLLALGEVFIFWRWPPLTDYYFILVWGGYILLVDHVVYQRSGRSLLRDAPLRLLAMFPLSALFWWVFEFYNQFLHNWRYLGGEEYQGLQYVLVASLFFSTVLPAVWETAELLLTFLPTPPLPHSPAPPLPSWLPALGLVLSVLPLIFPAYAFPLAWVGLFVLLDPLNARAGRPSIMAMLLRREWQVPLAFYVGTTITGFFWEFWNYWAWPKWVYTLSPWVESFPRLFEMPLPGYLGYGPFGWELFAMWWAVVGIVGGRARPVARRSPRPGARAGRAQG